MSQCLVPSFGAVSDPWVVCWLAKTARGLFVFQHTVNPTIQNTSSGKEKEDEEAGIH